MMPLEEAKDPSTAICTDWWIEEFSMAVGIYVVHLC